MSEPLVSIVVPAWNAARHIAAALDSVAAQDFREWELLVVDDGSTDDTARVVERWLSSRSVPGRLLRQNNSKVAAARNAGMLAARGEYIALLDSDDRWHPNKLSRCISALRSDRGIDLVCHSENVVRDGEVLRTLRYGYPESGAKLYEKLLFHGNALSPSACVFRRSVALAMGGFRPNLEIDTVEDYDFWMRFSRAGRMAFLDEVLGEYQVVEGSASRRVAYHYGNTENLLKEHLAEYAREHPGWRTAFRSRARLARVYQGALLQLLRRDLEPEVQRRYALRALRAAPWSPVSWGLAVWWALRRAVGRA